MIRVIRTETYEEMSRRAADFIAAQVILNPSSVLGLATGTTPVGTYGELAAKYRNGTLSFAGVRTVNLDEYLGLGAEHVQSYRYFMNRHLFGQIDIDMASTHVPDGTTSDPQPECASYDALIRDLGGIDLQLLGIGHNGHIGFNEPGEAFVTGTHVVTLTQRTIEANSRLFESADEVPRQALTMGMGAIMGAKRVLLIASGADKAEALHAALQGPVTPRMPASILQLHPDVTVICDAGAGSGSDAR